MDVKSMLLEEIDQELGNTRRVLERVPEDRLTWKPHAKSMSLGRLATHLAEIPGGMAKRLSSESFTMSAPGTPRPEPLVAADRAALLEIFDASASQLKAVVGSWDEAALAAPWSLEAGGHTVFTKPRLAALRMMVLAHSIHHRGQLTVYLRENDVPLPAIYGPTADEGL
jgi:uncharacterized damage-inducible protein DinB